MTTLYTVSEIIIRLAVLLVHKQCRKADWCIMDIIIDPFATKKKFIKESCVTVYVLNSFSVTVTKSGAERLAWSTMKCQLLGTHTV